MLNEKWYCGVLALFLVCAAAAEEETSKPSLLRRIQDVAEDRNEATPIGIQHCFLIVKGKNGSGSAFLAEFQGQTTIVSNAHVMLEIREPKIFDVDGREYEITEVVGSKSRDLVLAGFKAPAGQKPTPLKIAENVTAMPVGTPLSAYGNSGGASVITTLRGTLLASGPDSIEITCGIIGGNSGGPVLGKDDRVVGVSTYAQLLPYDVFATGSRFAGEWYEVVIRRFATRLDNLSIDDLEEINLKNLETEQNFVEKIERWEEDLLDVFRKNRNVGEAKLMAAIREHCIKFGGLLEEGGSLQWNSSYLKKKFNEKVAKIQKLLAWCGLKSQAEEGRLLSYLSSHKEEWRVTKLAQVPVRCFSCQGSGRYSISRPNPNYKGSQTLAASTIVEHHDCEACEGRGKRTAWSADRYVQVEPSLAKAVGERIPQAEETFCNFRLGSDRDGLFAQYPYYSNRTLLFRCPWLFGEVYRFRGNHAVAQAAATELVFMFGKLTAARIWFSGADLDPAKLLNEVWSSTKAVTDVQVSALWIHSDAEVPLDRSGRPLLNPVRNGSYPAPSTTSPNYGGSTGWNPLGARGGFGGGRSRTEDNAESNRTVYPGVRLEARYELLNTLEGMSLPLPGE